MTDTTSHKEQLNIELHQLVAELKDLGVEQPIDHDWVTTPEDVGIPEADPNVTADRSEEWIERRGTLAAFETRFNNIKRALAKIEAGTYGTCEIGGKAIEADRLEANPSARTCKAHIEDEQRLPL